MSASSILERIAGNLRPVLRFGSVDEASHAHVGQQSPEMLFLRGRALGRSGNLRHATKLFQDAVALDPNFADALEAEGEAWDLMGEGERARELFRTARAARARQIMGPPDRHYVLRQRGRFAAEILAYDSVVAALRKHSLPHLARGNAHLAAGRPAMALADYEQAQKLQPDLIDIHVVRGEAMIQLGRLEEATKEFDTVLAKRPRDAEALGGRAIARIGQGLVAEAGADWTAQAAVLAHRPAAVACIALRRAVYEEALPLLEKAVLSDPDYPYWPVYRAAAARRTGAAGALGSEAGVTGWPALLLAFHRGDVDAAAMLAKADTDGRRAEALFHIGVAEHQTDPAAARKRWQEVVAINQPWLIEYAAARNELSRA